ncbi:MAG TPA: hypothetical protein VFS18_00005, partial [Actinomycetota bacterium]|nr:hypothetical protein [Actinomycetota bacterium]
WNIPDSLPDGPYTLRATLFENNEAIDAVDQPIILNKTADRAELTYPGTTPDALAPADGSFGTFAPLASELPEKEVGTRGLPVGNLDGNHTGLAPGMGTAYVRGFYTISEPGTVPEWIACGTEGAAGNLSLSGAANAGVRCTLTKAEHQTAVTAVAVVANSSKDSFNAALNGVGDATRVLDAYAQTPASLSFLPESSDVIVQSNEDGEFGCHVATVHLSDQRGREITGANIDVHASGPTDKLRFDTSLLAPPSDVQPPDRHPAAMEPGYDCFTPSDQTGDNQSEHQILGGPDIKHVEGMVSGTEDTGDWSFGLWIPAGNATPENHTTQFTAWVDETDDGCVTNDDRFTTGEVSVSGVVGWDGAPLSIQPAASSELLSCVPPLEGRAGRSISMTSTKSKIAFGKRVTLRGALTSEYESCIADQLVKIRWRRPGKGFRTIQRVTSSAAGTYEASVKPKQGRNEYKAVAPRGESCKRARSSVAGVRAR